MVNLAIIGSRGYSNFNELSSIIDSLPIKIKCIVSGGAKGADKLGVSYAKINGIYYKEFIPNYNEFGKQAPFIRNVEIIDSCDVVIAFWDGSSNGTRHALKHAMKTNKKIYIFNYNTNNFIVNLNEI